MPLSDVYHVDLATIPMIDRMQSVGLLVDRDYCTDLSSLFEIEHALSLEHLHKLTGTSVNPHSGDQVADLLFGQMGIRSRRMTKSRKRPSTNGDILETLSKDERIPQTHRIIIDQILDCREIQKLKGTYADQLPTFIQADGRVHPNFRITRTATGRLSAFDPNLLAFPKHSARGKLVRGAVIAAADHELGEWDLSQIEMRVMAHDSQDANMIQQFLSGWDFHLMGAAQRYGKRPEDISKFERFTQKAINFGILMGLTEYGLLNQFHKNGQLQYTLNDCRRMLKEWGLQYPGCTTYISDKHAEARRKGYVTDMWGRIRWLPGVHSSDDYAAAAALREAQATPIQSGAQGIIKRIMAAMWPTIRDLSKQYFVAPLLQIHDALVFEYDRTLRPLLDPLIQGFMASTVHLRVPVMAEGTMGLRWSEL